MSIKPHDFARLNRINDPEDYRKVFRSSCCSVDGKFLVLARKNSLKQARLGLAISKKNISKATSRNQIKRAIRESFRHHKNLLKGLDIVVVAHKKQTIVDSKIIIESIKTHWKAISQCKKF